MTKSDNQRRTFLKTSGALTASMFAAPLMATSSPLPILSNDELYLIGPREGYTPRVGTLLSTMTMMRTWVVNQVEDLSVEELDFQIDDESNSIGAMLLHLAATEKYYQLNTFDNMPWGTWSADVKAEWDLPMNLGAEARDNIVGHEIDFYLSKLAEVRADTEKGFAERDDEWLMQSENFFGNQPTNNHCKWFHVCEHESNHNGQIKFIKKRINL